MKSIVNSRNGIMNEYRDVLFSCEGSLSTETAIVISVILLIITTSILFYISLLSGIDSFADGAVGYTGYFPADIHRVVTVVIQTGGDIIGKIS
mgnify:CR=1 FL=1